MLEVRKKDEAIFSALKLKGSPHVAHLRHHKDEYKRQVLSFINVNKNVKTVTDNFHTREDVEEHKKGGRKGCMENSLQPKLL